MNRHLLLFPLLATVVILSACGTGTSKRFITTPGSYDKMITFPVSGGPPDIEGIIKECPELGQMVDGKPRLVTAPEYLEEFAAELLAQEARGERVGLFNAPFKFPPGCAFSIEVPNEGISRSYTVGPHGYIDLPMIGEIRVLGRTVRDVKEELKREYRKYIKDPEVIVNVLSSPSVTSGPGGVAVQTQDIYGGSIVVLGAVATRWTANINYTGRETIVSVLGMAGLPADAEWRQIRVIRRSKDDPLRQSRMIICDLWNFFYIGDVKQDIPLMPGDVVFVPVKWTAGDQFQKDWDLVRSYIGGAATFDDLRESLRKGGRYRD